MDAKERAKRLLEGINKNESSSAEKSSLAKNRAKAIVDSGALDYNTQSAGLKKELAGVLSSGSFDKDKNRKLVEDYAGVQFKIFDNNLKSGKTGIKPIGENLSNLFKAHGYDFNELYPDIAEMYSSGGDHIAGVGNMEAYAYHVSPEFKKEYDENYEESLIKDSVFRSFEALNDVREGERKVEQAQKNTADKTTEYNAELARLNKESGIDKATTGQERARIDAQNRAKAAKNVGFLPSNAGNTLTNEEAEARKELGTARQGKIYADEGLYAVTTMRDAMKMPDFEEKSKYVDGVSPSGTKSSNGVGYYEILGPLNDFKDVEFKNADGTSYVVKANSLGYTEDQYKTLMYILNTKGAAAADKFREGIQHTVKNVRAQEEYNKLQELENGGFTDKLLSGFGQGVIALASGVEGLIQAGAGVKDTFVGGTEYFMPGAAQMITAKNKEDATTLGRIGLGAVEGVPQVAGTAALGAINPMLGSAFLASSAYGSSYVDAINSGATRNQAFAMGAMNAALEIALEKYVGSTIEGFGTSAGEKLGAGFAKTKLGQKFMTSFDDFARVHPKRATALKTIGTMFGNASSEFLEEYLSETAAPLMSYMILGKDGDFSLWSKEQAEAGFIGFITGAVLEGARGGITLRNLSKGGYYASVERIKALSDKAAIDEYAQKFGEQLSDGNKARAGLIASENFVVSTVAMAEYAKSGLSFEDALKKVNELGVNVTADDEFIKSAYELGSAEAISEKTDADKKLDYTGGKFADIRRLIDKGEATSYIASKMAEIGSISFEEAKKSIDLIKNKAFMESLKNTSMSDFEKAEAMKKYRLKEQALERMYRMGLQNLKFDASYGAGLISDDVAHTAFTRGQNARMLSQGKSEVVGSATENVSDLINRARASEQAKNEENKLREFAKAPSAPLEKTGATFTEKPEAEKKVVFEKATDEEKQSSKVILDSMGSEGVAVYNKIMGPITETVGNTQGKTDAYRKAIAYVYSQGKSGADVKRSMAQPLRLVEINAIYDAAKKDAISSKNAVRKANAKLIKDNVYKNATVSKREERILEGIAKIVGRDIRFSDELDSNAKIDFGTGEIIISTKSKTGTTWAMVHEVFHAMRMDTPTEANRLIRTVLDIIGKNEDAYKRYRSRYKSVYASEILNADGSLKSNAEDIIDEEMAADLIGFVISEAGVLEGITGNQRNVLLRFIDRLISFFSGDRLESIPPELRQAYREVKMEAERIREQFKDAIDKQAGMQGSEETKKTSSGEVGNVKMSMKLDASGNSYWNIETDKDIFKNLTKVKDLQNAAYDFILKGDKGEVVTSIIDGEELQFRRVGATEYLYGTDSKTLDSDSYKKKMRLSPSIIDLIKNATIKYDAPDEKDHKKFPDGFKNYQGRVGIDNKIFKYIVKVGKAVNGKVFYDICLKVSDVKVHHAESTSLIKKSLTFKDDYTTKNKSVNTSDQKSSKDLSSTTDNEYMRAVESGDMKSAQMMVDKAAREAGFDSPKLYHGTDAFGFTEFDLSKSDDKRTIFLTSNEKIASTYSGVSGERKISDVYNKNIDKMSTEDVAKELDRFVKDVYKDTFESADYNYVYYDQQKRNELRDKVDKGLEELRADVIEKIKIYADKMAVDFDDTTAKTHRQLVTLKERIDNRDFYNLSTPIYMLIHHTDAFNENSQKYGDLEANIRLLNQLRGSQQIAEGLVVEESLGRYSIEIMDRAEAVNKLKELSGKGNYSLYAKMEKPLVIDGRGQNWNNIRGWSDALVADEKQYELYDDNENYYLKKKTTGEVIKETAVDILKVPTGTTSEVLSFLINKYKNMLAIRFESRKTTLDIAGFAKQSGYDGVVIKNITDNGGRNHNVEMYETADIYILFDPENAKSADPVTYDDNGDIIPLSERFNPEKKDIRWSKDLSSEEIRSDDEITINKEEQRARAREWSLKRWGADIGRTEDVPSMSIEGAIKKVKESFGINITSGGDASVSGNVVDSYNVDSKTIRTKFKNDLPSISHALGYHIDTQLQIVDKVIGQTDRVRELNGEGVGEYETELLRLAPDSITDSRKKVQEGFAEFIRTYLVSKALAMESAPIFYSYFEQQLSGNEDLKNAVEESAKVISNYFAQSTGDRIGASVMSAEDWAELNKPRGKEAVSKMRDYIVTRLFDRYYGIKRAEKKHGVFDLSTSKNAYVRATLSLMARGKSARILEDGFYDRNGNKVGEAFFDIIAPLGADYSDKFKAFDNYLSFVHAIEWLQPNDLKGKKTSSGKDIYNAKAKGKVFGDDSLNNVDELKRLITEYEAKYPEFKGIAKKIYKYQDNLMEYYYIPSGAVSRDQAETFRAQYPHYVPFNRFNSIFGDATNSGKKGMQMFANLANPIKKADGGNAPIRSPLESIMNSTFKAVDFMMKQDVMHSLIKEFTGNGSIPGVMERIYSSKELEKLNEKGKNPFMTEEGLSVDESTETAFNPTIDKEKGIVHVWVNGEKRFYQVYDRDLYNAVANLEVQNLRGLFKVFNTITNMMKVTMTMRNPIFAPGNFYRDFMTFHYNTTSEADIFSQLGMYVGSLKSVLTKDDSYQLYKALGGLDATMLRADTDVIKRTVKDRNASLVKWSEASARDIGEKLKRNVLGLKWLWDKYFEFNDIFETLPRLAEFKYTLKETGDVQLSMYRSQDVTTNFSRNGTWGRNVNAIFLFSNAELQGIDKMVRNYTEAEYEAKNKKGQPAKMRAATRVLKTVGWSLIMTALSEFINRRDDEAEEEYRRLSEFTKNNYDVFYMGSGYFVKLPKEQNLAMPRTTMQRIFDFIKGDSLDLRELGGYIWSGISPDFLPDIFDLGNAPQQVLNNTPIGFITDVAFNMDYKGDAIVPYYMSGPEFTKYTNYTSAFAVSFAENLYKITELDVSPMAIDHYLGAGGYYGTLFKNLFPVVDYEEKGFIGSIKNNFWNALGFKTRFKADARYSTDLLNNIYDGKERALKRLSVSDTGENRIVSEKYSVLSSFISSYDKVSRLGNEEQQRLDRKMLQVILEGFDEGKLTEGEKYVMSLYDETGIDDVFISTFPSFELRSTKTKKGKKTITSATLTANQYAEFCADIETAREKVRVLIKGLGLDSTDAAQLLAKEYKNINADIKEKYLEKYGVQEVEKVEKKKTTTTKSYEKSYQSIIDDLIEKNIYGD